ncbi:hypothetical protein CMK11_08935 [Candidatus Poribacteria bacterium]|nr:hypothetical protein [Candidatus Poribacteria bacterium]
MQRNLATRANESKRRRADIPYAHAHRQLCDGRHAAEQLQPDVLRSRRPRVPAQPKLIAERIEPKQESVGIVDAQFQEQIDRRGRHAPQGHAVEADGRRLRQRQGPEPCHRHTDFAEEWHVQPHGAFEQERRFVLPGQGCD